jgi:putative intracellular protease/amidase
MTSASAQPHPTQIAIGLYEGFTALDAIGPYQVFSNMPGVEVVICAERTGPLADDNRLLHFEIGHDFADVPAPDVLLVPGGVITRKLAREHAPIVDWIVQAHPHTTWTTSVCTGALLLGAAGILDGLPATTHWCAYDELRKYGAEPTEQRVVQAGKIITGAGVSAGIDLALTVAGMAWGRDAAEALQLAIEYDPQPPFDAGAPSKARPELIELIAGAVSAQEAAL